MVVVQHQQVLFTAPRHFSFSLFLKNILFIVLQQNIKELSDQFLSFPVSLLALDASIVTNYGMHAAV